MEGPTRGVPCSSYFTVGPYAYDNQECLVTCKGPQRGFVIYGLALTEQMSTHVE